MSAQISTCEEKYDHLLPALETIAQEHPEYGWPRVAVELREKHGHHVNHKVVQRLLRLWDLRLMRSTRRPKPGGVQRAIKAAGKRANLVAHIEDIEPFQVIYTDFTELRFADGRQKGHLIPIIGHASKMVYGWAVGETTDTTLALKAWQWARGALQRLGIRCAGMILHQDQDPVFTSYAWTAQLLRKDGVRLSYALRGAKDNPEMESFNSRFKTEGNSLFLDAPTLADLDRVVDGRMCYHNRERRHSAPDYVASRVYVDQVLNGTGKRS